MKTILAIAALLAPGAASAAEWEWAAQFDPTTQRSTFRAGIAGEGGTFEFGCSEGQPTWMRIRPTGYFGYGNEADGATITVSSSGTQIDHAQWRAAEGAFLSTRPVVDRFLRSISSAPTRVQIGFGDETPSIDIRFARSDSAEVRREAERTCERPERPAR